MSSTACSRPTLQLDSITTALKDAFGSLSIFKRLFLIVWLLFVVPLYNLNMFLAAMFSRDKNKPLKKLDENMWVVGGNFYLLWKFYPSYMLVIKGKDGNILLFNPIEPQHHTLKQIEELGPIKAIFVANHFHDTWVGQWKSLFPDATFHTVKCMRGQVEKCVGVDSIVEDDVDLAENFGITKFHDVSVFMRPGIFDYMLSIETESKKKMLVLPHCATTETASLQYFFGWILGYAGMGYSRINGLIYVKDLKGLMEYTNHVLKTAQPSILFTTHGKSLNKEEDIARFIRSVKC